MRMMVITAAAGMRRMMLGIDGGIILDILMM